MKITKGENITKQLFKENFNIECEIIPRKSEKTADYFLKADGKIIAVCEVKDIELQGPLIEKGDIVDEEGGFESFRDCNDVGRIGKKIQESFPQLEYYNESKVLVIVDFDDIPRPLYFLNAAVTGKGGARIVITETEDDVKTYADSRHISEGKIKDVKKKIDLYFWLNVCENTIKSRYFQDNLIGKELGEFIESRRKT